jgi:hypothetical protein
MPAPLAVLAGRWQHPPTLPGRLVVPPSLRAFFLASFQGPVLVVVPGEREAEELADDLALFAEVVHLPAWETLLSSTCPRACPPWPTGPSPGTGWLRESPWWWVRCGP